MKSSFLFLLVLSIGVNAQKPVDKLNIPGPFILNKKTHVLAWTAQPSAVFYKQEYIPVGDNLNKFNSMVLIDVSLGNFNLKDIVTAKLDELKKMKETNPLVNYEVFQKNGEYLLDFLLSAGSGNGNTVEIVEHNVYRYKIFTTKAGKAGVMLFGVSTRSYGNNIDSFLKNLKSSKSIILNEVARYNLPAVLIK